MEFAPVNEVENGEVVQVITGTLSARAMIEEASQRRISQQAAEMYGNNGEPAGVAWQQSAWTLPGYLARQNNWLNQE